MAVGLITLDTPELFARYFDHRPAARERFDVRLSIGMGLMDAQKSALTPYAAANFMAALALTDGAQLPERLRDVATQSFLALFEAVCYQRRSGDPLAAKPFHDELRHLTAHHPEAEHLARARAEELCRIAHAAGSVEEYASARAFLDVAVARFPDEEEPWRLRAKVDSATGAHDDALVGATEALARNADRIRAGTARRNARHKQDRHNRDHDDARIGGLRGRRFEELNIAVTALLALGRGTEARGLAEEMTGLKPDEPDGFLRLAGIEQLAGKPALVLARLYDAHKREQDPGRRATIDTLIAGLEAEAAPRRPSESATDGRTDPLHQAGLPWRHTR